MIGLESLELRAMLAAVSGSVHRSIDVSDIAPNDPTFGPIPQVTIQLRNDGGTVIAQQVSDSNGLFSFTGVPAGRHQVAVVLPEGYMGTSAQGLSYSIVVGSDDVSGLGFALASRKQAVVQNLHELVLQRPATLGELTAAVGRLSAGGTVANEFGRLIASKEFRTVVRPVAGFVEATLPGVLEIELVRASAQQQRLGISADATVQSIMNTQKFVSVHGDTSLLSNSDYVQFIYRQLLGQAPSARQAQSAVGQLVGGMSRGQLALNLTQTAAFQARVQVQRSFQASVTYVGLLGREATLAEVRNYARGRGTAVDLAGRLARSAEFRSLTGFTSTAVWDTMAMSLAPPVSSLSRLQQYNPVTQQFDIPVTAGSITSSVVSPKNVYFVAHGWMAGLSQEVLLKSTPGDPYKFWAPFSPISQVSSTSLAQAIVDKDPKAIVIGYSWIDLSATPLAEEKVSVTVNATGKDSDPILTVSSTAQLSAGMQVTGPNIPEGTKVFAIASPTQVVLSAAPSAPLANTPLLFSGVDLESTIRSFLYVGRSESRAQLAGLMLADAVRQALAPDFFGDKQGLLHMLGQSHGSKVATIATVALEQAGVPVSQLTLFESPEVGPTKPHALVNSEPLGVPGIGGGQNFSWRFLQDLPTISKTPVAIGRQPTGGTFVENYYSYTGFGEAMGGYAGLGQIVDVMLRPAELSNPKGGIAGDLAAALTSHQYPPGWYAQASLQNPAGPGNTQNGLSWSPLLDRDNASSLAASYDQYPQGAPTTSGEFVQRQFELATGGSTPATTVNYLPFSYATQPTVGTVTDTGSTMTLGVGGSTALSMATVNFVPYASNTTENPLGTGLELDVSFTGVDPGETVQLIVSAHGAAVPQLALFGQQLFMTGSTGFMTMPLLTLDGGYSGSGPRMATVSLDVFRTSGLIDGGFATAANPVPQLVFSLLGSAGSTASVTISNMRQFGTPTTPV